MAEQTRVRSEREKERERERGRKRGRKLSVPKKVPIHRIYEQKDNNPKKV